MPGGYSYEGPQLLRVWGKFIDGANAMDTATRSPANAPDAGSSSDTVAATLGEVFALAIGTESVLRDIAVKVHTATGAYDTVENNAQGEAERLYWKSADDNTRWMRDQRGGGS